MEIENIEYFIITFSTLCVFLITVQGVLYIQMQNITDASRERKLDVTIQLFNIKSCVCTGMIQTSKKLS